jgi:hypothetical protein
LWPILRSVSARSSLIIFPEDVALNSDSYYFDRSGDRSGSDNMANREDQSASARRSHRNARSGPTSARRINRVGRLFAELTRDTGLAPERRVHERQKLTPNS